MELGFRILVDRGGISKDSLKISISGDEPPIADNGVLSNGEVDGDREDVDGLVLYGSNWWEDDSSDLDVDGLSGGLVVVEISADDEN